MVEKGLSALESLLFAQVSDVPERVLASRGAERDGDVQAAGGRRARRRRARRRARSPDSPTRALLHDLAQRAPSALLARLRERRLYKRAFECPAADLPPDAGEWIADDRALTVAVENALAR